MEKFFNEEVASQIKDILTQMKNEITIKLFIDGACDTCLETKQLLEETAELNAKIKLVVHEVKKDVEEAKKYDITLTPSFVFLDDKGTYKGVKFSGFPGGHEINSFLSAVIEMSGNLPEFPQELLDRIAKIDKPVDIKVFVTLSCPHCPPAVETAHRLAMLNPNIKGVMIEAQTFNEMSNKYKVSGVPKIVINDKHELLGNQPIEEFLNKIELL
ncbi:MAG: thioredoxin family protein [Bacilli bacterium]|nr:thioredoxin family protein [Bacilli bacterium]